MMTIRGMTGNLLAVLSFLLTTQTCAAEMTDDIRQLQLEWAVIKYQTAESGQEKLYEALAAKAGSVTARYPDKAEPHIWEGIILSTWAGAKGGLGALSLARESRKQLETAIAIDPDAMQGSAYTSLGTLYFKVPGWPVGFGDTEKAEELLKQALVINPDGIDPNFFYGEFLLEEDRYAESVAALNKALQAAPRPDRPIADAGRKAEIQETLAKARKHLE
jgi:tetratricopeptide (TPR) repeat protein